MVRGLELYYKSSNFLKSDNIFSNHYLLNRTFPSLVCLVQSSQRPCSWIELYSRRLTTCQLGVKIAPIERPIPITVKITTAPIVDFLATSDILLIFYKKYSVNSWCKQKDLELYLEIFRHDKHIN